VKVFIACMLVCLLSTPLLAEDDAVIVTAEQIESLQAHTMADILGIVPGVSAGSSSVSIHGNSRVKVYLDGRSLNDPTSSHGGIKWGLVTISDIEQIEILRGKGGVHYGQDASGGVILITSKSGNRVSGHLKSFGGSQERYSINSNLQVSSDPWQTSINGGYKTNNGYQINGDKKRYQLGTSLGYAFHKEAHISLSADYTEDKRGYAGYPDYPTPFSRNESKVEAYTVQGDLNRTSSKTYLNRGEKNNSDISRGLDKKIEVDDFGQELDSSYHTENLGDFSYGGGFYWSGASGSGFNNQDETTCSLYLIDIYDLSSIPLSLSLGLRANINSTFDNTFNPESKLTYKHTYLKATLSYNRTNNTPSFYQRYNEASTKKPNPELGMELADNFSLAIFSKLSDKVSGSTTLFHNRLSDKITYTYAGNGNSQYQNVGTATYNGCDLSLSWSPIKEIKLKVNYTYLVAKDENSDKDLPVKPRNRGRINLIYKPVEPLSVIFIGRGNSDAFRNRSNTKIIPGYFVYDYKMEYSFERFSLFTEVTNFMDDTYYYIDGLLAPPRAWFAGINIKL